MKEHTFQVGDRVRMIRSTGDVYGYITGSDGKAWWIRRDDGVEGGKPPDWTTWGLEVKHDTNFQVGDWVRYEGVNYVSVTSKEGQVGQIVRIDGDMVDAKGIHGTCDKVVTPASHRENLVKIQPSQEAQVKTVKIQHEKYGVVEGASSYNFDTYWTKDGHRFYRSDGWSQVPEKEWVTIQVEKEGWERIKFYDHVYGYSDEARDDGEKTEWREPQ